MAGISNEFPTVEEWEAWLFYEDELGEVTDNPCLYIEFD